MEFWGLEVLPGTTVKVDPGENKYLHLSQASLGETKKDKGENVPIFVKVDGKKLVLGSLSYEKCAQIQYDLVFEKEFEISHGSKNANIYLFGYKTVAMEEGDDMMSDEFDSQSESDDEVPVAVNVNGKPDKDDKPKPTAAKPNVVKAEASTKPKPKVEEPKKDVKAKPDVGDGDGDDDDDDDEDDSSEEEESDDDEDTAEGEEDSDDEDEEDSSDEDEETPKKAEVGSKRPAGSASKTPVPEKKAKVVSPVGIQKTGGKKGSSVHIATPHPAKQGKTSANADKSKQQQTPKSTGSVTCKSCSKTFNSDNALQAHTKAKHSAK